MRQKSSMQSWVSPATSARSGSTPAQLSDRRADQAQPIAGLTLVVAHEGGGREAVTDDGMVAGGSGLWGRWGHCRWFLQGTSASGRLTHAPPGWIR